MLETLRNNGIKPRYRSNRLLFLAPDHGAMVRLRDCIRTALAWGSIVDDVRDGRLNIDQLQRRQAEKELQVAEEVLPRAARECYKWLLCPAQYTPTDPKPTVEAFALNTGGAALGSELERTCLENELVIATWSPVHLRAKLQELYWKPDKPAIGAMAFWEDSLRYLFLPRFKNRSVLEKAVALGAASRDFFGIAYGQHDGKYDGFKLGGANVQLDDTLLLIEPGAAAAYEAAQLVALAPEPIDGGGYTYPQGKSGSGSGTPVYETPDAPQYGAGQPAPARTFIGTVDVNAATAKMRLVQIADEIISLLGSDPQAVVRVSVEISAEFPAGVADSVKRAVSENAGSLGFKHRTWE